MPVAKWTEGYCPQCGSQEFLPVEGFRYHPTGGSVWEIKWRVCLACHHKADPEQLRLAQRRQELQLEMEALVLQSAALDASLTAASLPVSNASPTTPAAADSNSRSTAR